MCTGLMFEVEKAGLPQKEKEKIALDNPQGWNPSLVERRGIITADGTWKAFTSPLQWGLKMKISLIFTLQLMGKMLRDQQHSQPASQTENSPEA